MMRRWVGLVLGAAAVVAVLAFTLFRGDPPLHELPPEESVQASTERFLDCLEESGLTVEDLVVGPYGADDFTLRRADGAEPSEDDFQTSARCYQLHVADNYARMQGLDP